MGLLQLLVFQKVSVYHASDTVVFGICDLPNGDVVSFCIKQKY